MGHVWPPERGRPEEAEKKVRTVQLSLSSDVIEAGEQLNIVERKRGAINWQWAAGRKLRHNPS